MRFLFLVLGLSFSFGAWAQTELVNVTELQKALGLQAYTTKKDYFQKLKNIKIAILDLGFGKEASVPSRFIQNTGFPDSTVLVTEYESLRRVGDREYSEDGAFIEEFNLSPGVSGNALDLKKNHGLTLARILWEITGRSSLGPRLYLLNASGVTNLKRAVQYAILEEVDIILYAVTWQHSHGFDGTGSVNEIVKKATDAGILWVNNAGNQGGSVYHGQVQVGKDGFLKFGEKNYLGLKTSSDENEIEVTVTWKDEKKVSRDLDVFFEDPKGEVLVDLSGEPIQGNREQVQLEEPRGGSYPLPTELVKAELRRRTQENEAYRLKIKAMAGEFSEDAWVRVTISAKRESDFTLVDATHAYEIGSPADSEEVITVGDLSSFSAKGPTVDGRTKPDFLLGVDSKVMLTSYENSVGTSNSAAFTAGMIAVLKTVKPDLTREQVLKANQTPEVDSCFEIKETDSISEKLQKVFREAELSYRVGYDSQTQKEVLLLPQSAGAYEALFPGFDQFRAKMGRTLGDYRYYLSGAENRPNLPHAYYAQEKRFAQVLPLGAVWLEALNLQEGYHLCGEGRLWTTPSPEILQNLR